MISYEQLCEALDRYNARRKGPDPSADDPAYSTPDMAVAAVATTQEPQPTEQPPLSQDVVSDSIEVDESMIATDGGESAEDLQAEWEETVPLTGDMASPNSDGLSADSPAMSQTDDEIPPS